MKDSKVGQKLPKGITHRKGGLYMGRFQYKSERFVFYGRDLKKLKKELSNKRYEVEHGLYGKESKMTVNAWFEIWIKEYKTNSIKYGTLVSYKNAYKNHVEKILGKRKLVDIRPEHVQKILNGMNGRYSHATIKLVAIVLNGMYKQAFKNEIIRRNPVACTTIPRNTEMKRFRVLNLKEQELFHELSKGSVYCSVYQVALGTGMRVGELKALEWSDIDFENRIIHVSGTLKYRNGNGYYKDTPKTRSSVRDIPMLDSVYKCLKEQKREQLKYKMSLGAKWSPIKGLEQLVFCREFGKPISHMALNDDMRKIETNIREKAEQFEHIVPHTLRHTFATRGLENGIPPKVMQDLLGHTSITMTLDIYSHVLPNTKAKEIQKLAGLF